MDDASIPYLYLIGMSVLLLLLLIAQLAYIFWSREKEKYWRRYKKKFRSLFTELLFSFLENEIDADTVIKKLTKRTQDITFFLELLNELTEILRGEMRERLNLLIEHNLFLSYYKKKLFSVYKRNQLIACIYFAHVSKIDDDIKNRLLIFSSSDSIKLSFAATKALQSARDINIRKTALIKFLRKNQASELMITELLFLFSREEEEFRLLTGEVLIGIVKHKKIPAEEKKVVINFMAHQKYMEPSKTLHEYLKKIQLDEKNISLAAALIRALAELHELNAIPTIRDFMTSGYTEIQIACVKALGSLGEDEILQFLANQLLQVPFSVQKEVVRVLIQHSPEGLQLLKNCLEISQKNIHQANKHIHTPAEREQTIDRIKNSALFIRSVLPVNAQNI